MNRLNKSFLYIYKLACKQYQLITNLYELIGEHTAKYRSQLSTVMIKLLNTLLTHSPNQYALHIASPNIHSPINKSLIKNGTCTMTSKSTIDNPSM